MTKEKFNFPLVFFPFEERAPVLLELQRWLIDLSDGDIASSYSALSHTSTYQLLQLILLLKEILKDYGI